MTKSRDPEEDNTNDDDLGDGQRKRRMVIEICRVCAPISRKKGFIVTVAKYSL